MTTKLFYFPVIAMAFASCNAGHYYFNKRIDHATEFSSPVLREQNMEMERVSMVEIKNNVSCSPVEVKSRVEQTKKEEITSKIFKVHPDSLQRRVIEDRNGNL